MGKTTARDTALIFAFILGIIGTAPLYAMLFILNLRLYFLCIFIGFGFCLGYHLIKREEPEIKKEILIIVSALIVTVFTAVCAECIFSYQTYMIQCSNLGITQTYAEILRELPLPHLLGYYIGLDLLEIGNDELVFNTVVAMWMNIVQSLIFSLIGTQLIKGYFYFEKKLSAKK